MKREFNVVIEQDEDGFFVASVPALRGCHTQARSLDVLMKRIKEAITSSAIQTAAAPLSQSSPAPTHRTEDSANHVLRRKEAA